MPTSPYLPFVNGMCTPSIPLHTPIGRDYGDLGIHIHPDGLHDLDAAAVLFDRGCRVPGLTVSREMMTTLAKQDGSKSNATSFVNHASSCNKYLSSFQIYSKIEYV